MNLLKIIFTFLFALFFSLFTSKAQQKRAISDFNFIKAGDSFTILLKQGEQNSLKVNAPENVQEQVKTEVKDGILNIFSEGTIKTKDSIIVTISFKSLRGLDISGLVDIKIDNQLQTDTFSLISNGGGKISLNIIANILATKITGSGDVNLTGSTKFLDAHVSGAGSLNAANFEASKIKVKVSGTGDAKVNAIESIDAEVLSSGSIIYKGNPPERNVNISGIGSVRESKSGTGEETASDTTKFKLGKHKYMIIGDEDDQAGNRVKKDSLKNHKNSFKHWNGYELGINGLMDYKNSIHLPASSSFLDLDYSKSLQIGLNIAEKYFHIYKNHINLITGFGIDLNHYSFKNNITLYKKDDYLSATKDTLDYKKNRLSISYLKVPVMLEWNSSINSPKHFHIAAGFEFGYAFGVRTLQKFYQNNKTYRIRQKSDYNVDPFLSSATIRLGYGKFTIYGKYGINRLFTKNKGPQVYPFTVGINLGL